MIKTPILFINFKTYQEATGKNALEIAKLCEKISKEKKASIALVVQAADIRMVAEKVKLPVFAQHIDPVVYGSNTGSIMPEAVKEAGAVGTIINHAENKRSNEFLEKAVKRAKEAGLLVMACAETVERAEEIATFAPDFIAAEPPELIGGNISVSTAKPEIITGSVERIKKVNSNISVITGAGIKNRADVEKALELGTDGVFVASGIIKAKDMRKAIEEMVGAFKGR